MSKYVKAYEMEIADIIIDTEFKRLFPRLNDEDFAGLEESLCNYGCLSPLIVWNNILIDGYNRFEIITKHDLPFRVIALDFATREDVIIWMIAFQIQSRNLDPMQLSYYRGLHYNTEKKRHGDTERFINSPRGHVDPLEKTGHTAEKLADEYDVSPKTIKRDAKLAETIISIGEKSPEAKELILSGKANISRKRLIELSAADEDEVIDTIEQINSGTHQPRRSNASDSLQPGVQLTFDGFIERIANEIDSGIKKLSSGNNEVSKTAIRSLIGRLEQLYENL